MIDEIYKLNRRRETMVDNEVKLVTITNFIINDKEQYAYHLRKNRLETFAVAAVGYRDGVIAPTLPQLEICVTTLMLEELAYTKTRKNIYIPLVRAELEIRGVNHQEAKTISKLIKLLKENEMITVNKESSIRPFSPQSRSNDAWL